MEDVEDVACRVDDMEATNRSPTLVQKGRSDEGSAERGFRPYSGFYEIIEETSIQTAQGERLMVQTVRNRLRH